MRFKTRFFYAVKPVLPRRTQLALRRRMVQRRRTEHAARWPIDPNAAVPPSGWRGWPGGKQFAVVLTHDVEHFAGQFTCLDIARMERERGFTSSFNFVPERYPVSSHVRQALRSMGFEVGVHDLNHDGKLFSLERLFNHRARAINRYLAQWKAAGFRAGGMHHNLEWIGRLDIEYDCSTFDTDPFEPQPDGVGTIFPFRVRVNGTGKEFVEMPYTLPQDFTLFVLMGEEGPAIWKRKLDWVAANGGMVLVNTHPDYMCLEGTPTMEQYPARYYAELLDYLRSRYAGRYWHTVPAEVARFWKSLPEETSLTQVGLGRRPLKVCMAAYTFYEGDNRVRRYAEALAARGDHVDVIALRQDNSPKSVQVRGVNVYKIQRRAINERKKLDYLLRLLSFLVRSTWHLAVRHASRRYDLVHVHSVPDFEVFAALIPKLSGAAVVLDIHDIVPELYVGKFGARKESALFRALVLVERLSARFANHVIIANDIWYERMTGRSVSARKCSVVMNYPDPSLFYRRDSQAHRDTFVLLYPGTLSRHQGLDTAIRAVGLLGNRIPGLELHIYGSGTDEGSFREMVKQMGLESKVLFKGLVSIEQVADVMALADVGIEPKSRAMFGDEAFSTKILEFLMVGRPVVVSDTTVHRRYLEEGVVKFFSAGDYEELAEAIEMLYRTPHLRERYVEKGLAFMNSNHWGVKKRVYLDLIDSLTGAAPRHEKVRSLEALERRVGE